MSFTALLNQLAGSPGGKGAIGGALSGAAVSLLMNKSARKALGKSAIQVGGAAAIAGVGYYAYQKWKQSQQSAQLQPVTASGAETPKSLLAAPPVSENLAATIVKAMIATAMADRKLQPEQLQRIEKALDNPVLTEEEILDLTAALSNPPGVTEILAGIRNIEEASEVYGACLAVVDAGNAAENVFLRRLARSMELPEELLQTLHASAQEELA